MLVKKFNYVDIPRIDTDEGRRYHTPSGDLPSVTSILDKTKSAEKKKALENWRDFKGDQEADRILTESQNIGTIIHKHLENHIMSLPRPGGTNIIHVKARKLADVLINEGLSNMNEVWGTEVSLYYPSLYAGTTDCVGVHKGEPAIVDFKNSRKIKKDEFVLDYKTQMVAYSEAHNIVYGTNIKKGVVMLVVRDDLNHGNFGKYQEWILEGEEFEHHKQLWYAAVEKYYSNTNS